MFPFPSSPLFAASSALLGFWFTKLAVGIALVGVKHIMLGDTEWIVLMIPAALSAGVATVATRQAASMIAAAINRRSS